MKRVLPVVILLAILKVGAIVWFGIWFWTDRYVNISDVKIIKECISTEHKIHCIDFVLNNKEYRSEMGPETYDFFYKKNHQLKYQYADTYVSWGIIYIIFVVFYGIWFLLRTIDFFEMYKPWEDKGERFSAYRSIFPDFYAYFYNAIDSYDLTPVYNHWYKFWGY